MIKNSPTISPNSSAKPMHQAKAATEEPYSSEAYLLHDYGRSLFPLTSVSFLVTDFVDAINETIYKKVLNKACPDYHFLPQQRCYAAKSGFHLRRTVKLDPIAEFFIYDIVYRNRKSFRPDARRERRSFGYRFSRGRPISAAEAYGAFKAAIAQAREQYPFTLVLDVATYFNSIYHHDLMVSVRELGWPEPDVEAIGTFLREINAGRSIDCLPHGLHPCKVLGAEFLRFIDNSYRIKSKLLLRFVDDLHLFATDARTLTSDLLTIQELLGERGLSLNTSKTFEGATRDPDVAESVDEIKASLLQIRRRRFVEYDEVREELEEEMMPLNDEQVEYLLSLINSPDVEESDVELVLSLLRDHGEDVLPRMVDVLERFPGLTKSIYNYTRFTSDREGLDDLLLSFLGNSPLATEYQLFWLTKLAEDFLPKSPKYGDILLSAYDHSNSTTISRAKVLEIPDKRFGLPELRAEHLRAGRSDWEAWASAVGTRHMAAAGRNHLLSYFANGSYLNKVIAECVKKA